MDPGLSQKYLYGQETSKSINLPCYVSKIKKIDKKAYHLENGKRPFTEIVLPGLSGWQVRTDPAKVWQMAQIGQ
jgi:hypothetical protein